MVFGYIFSKVQLINIATNEGDLILDPFMGVGSTGIAAIEMNRRFIGIEIEKNYFEAAQKRFDEIQPNLLTGAVNGRKAG